MIPSWFQLGLKLSRHLPAHEIFDDWCNRDARTGDVLCDWIFQILHVPDRRYVAGRHCHAKRRQGHDKIDSYALLPDSTACESLNSMAAGAFHVNCLLPDRRRTTQRKAMSNSIREILSAPAWYRSTFVATGYGEWMASAEGLHCGVRGLLKSTSAPRKPALTRP